MGRSRKRTRKLSTAPVPYPTIVLQSAQAEPQGEEFRRHQRKRPAHPDLDSLDCYPAAEVAAPSLQSQVVPVQPGVDAPAESVYLSGFTQVAGRSVRDAATTARIPATYSGTGMIWTGSQGQKGGPRSEDLDSQRSKRLVSEGGITTLSCFGQQCISNRLSSYSRGGAKRPP